MRVKDNILLPMYAKKKITRFQIHFLLSYTKLTALKSIKKRNEKFENEGNCSAYY